MNYDPGIGTVIGLAFAIGFWWMLIRWLWLNYKASKIIIQMGEHIADPKNWKNETDLSESVLDPEPVLGTGNMKSESDWEGWQGPIYRKEPDD